MSYERSLSNEDLIYEVREDAASEYFAKRRGLVQELNPEFEKELMKRLSAATELKVGRHVMFWRSDHIDPGSWEVATEGEHDGYIMCDGGFTFEEAWKIICERHENDDSKVL